MQQIFALLCYLGRGVTLPGRVFEEIEDDVETLSWKTLGNKLYRVIDEEFDHRLTTYNVHILGEHLVEQRSVNFSLLPS